MKKIIIPILLLGFILSLTSCKKFKSKGISRALSKNINKSTEEEQAVKENKFPKPLGYVSDFEGTLKEKEERALAEIIEKYREETTNQIAIVSVAKIEPYDHIFDYSLALAKEWGVGLKDKNNGIVIVYSQSLQKVQIQNGKGMTDMLTDEETGVIVDEIMKPQFSLGQNFKALKAGLEAIIKETTEKP